METAAPINNAESIISGVQPALRRISAQISQRAIKQKIHEGNLTDVAFLARASDYALQLDEVSFKGILDKKLVDFQERADSFKAYAFTDERLFAWCRALRRLTGHFNIANKHFLENTGSFIDSSRYIEDVAGLISNGLIEIERRYGADIETPLDWARRYNDPDVVARRALAQAINYMGRYAYTFRFADAFEKSYMPLLEGRFDVVSALANPAMLPFTNRNSVMLAKLEYNCNQLIDFFDSNKGGSYTALADDFLNYTACVKHVLNVTVRNLAHLTRHDDVLMLMRNLGLDIKTLVRSRLISTFMPSLLLRYDGIGEIEQALREDVNRKPDFGLQILLIKTLARMGRTDEAIVILSQIAGGEVKTYAQLSSLARLIEGLLPAVEQKKLLKSTEKTISDLTAHPIRLGDENTVARIADIERMEREIGVFEDYEKAINELLKHGALKPDADRAIGSGERIVLFSMIQDRVSPVVLVSLMPILQKAGARFFNLIDDGMTNDVVRPWPFTPRLTPNFEAIQSPEEEKNSLLNTWVVAPERREISCNGVNYYEGFYERISRVLKVYSVDWTLPHARHFLDLWLRQSDRAIAALDKVRIVLKQKSAKATLVSLQSQFAPYFVMKMYADRHPECFEHVTLSSSYENWATNVSGKPVSSLTILNNTLHPQPSAPAFGRTDHFEKWFSTDFVNNRKHFAGITKKMTGIARAGALSSEAREILEPVYKRKHGGKSGAFSRLGRLSMSGGRSKPREGQVRVFCALGKIPYDLAVPYQGGPAHRDIKDWLNHTIEVFSGCDDILFVKPHPHELNYAISHKPNETFLDLIENKKLPDNIIILPYRGVSLQDLFPLVDHFLCWNGSSIPELGSQGFSILACDDWARKNYPVEVALPLDRDHYEKMLRGESDIVMHPQFRERCTAYVPYMVEAPFAIRNPYVGRSATNTDFNRAWINWDSFTPEKLDELQGSADLINAMLLGQKGAAN